MDKINFQNGVTPLNDTNLNQMQTNVENAINNLAIGTQCMLPLNDDWDTGCTETGFYMGMNLQNAPENQLTWFYVINMIHNEKYATQIAKTFFGNIIWTRVKTSGAWGKWERASANNYSTEEQVIGTYTKPDGTIVPLYRKVVNIGSVSVGVQKTEPTGITNVDTLVSQKSIATLGVNSSEREDIFSYGNGMYYSAYNPNEPMENCKLILEYTKTTDN